MITLTPVTLAEVGASLISTDCAPGGTLFINQRDHASVMIFPRDLDALLQDVKIAIAFRDAK